MSQFKFAWLLLALVACCEGVLRAENWPRWRGPDGNAVSTETDLPVRWSTMDKVRWKIAVPGQGTSSPIVWGEHVIVTTAFQNGLRRAVFCFDRSNGQQRWNYELTDDDPEISSILTGHAAATPATDGTHIVASFGNAGIICLDLVGKLRWRKRFGTFETDLGLASSPIFHDEMAILVCDHDGNRFRSFDSFVIALDLKTGETKWKTDRPDLYRSWSTPIVVSANDKQELIINAQDELRGYDPASGMQLWRVPGMTGWVTPSPIFAHGMIFATSGRDGPTLAVRPGGRGDVAATHLVWREPRGAPYVCSPLVYGEYLYVHNEAGILVCRAVRSGKEIYRQRLEGKFTASGVAADGKVYLANEEGVTFVIKAGPQYELLARNALDGECLASPAISGGNLFLRTDKHLYCIGP